ncbi:cardiolipin synthase [Massilia sp. METH4]|uniref:cardiolipin synthase n=1 Tax=Massilia sp. METH4 TaxID=3123041 RepID=UPI0030D45E31
MKRWNPRRILAVILAGWCLAACASLPAVDPDKTKEAAAAVPVVKSVNGTLPESRAKALLSKRWAKNTLDLKAQAALEEAATGVPLIAGNQARLLFDGPQTMAEMMKAIEGAKNHINFETYIFDQDEMGDRFADLLIAKQKAGVTVNVIYDSVGTLLTPQSFFDRMRAAGIHMIAYNPVNPAKVRGNGWKVNNRDHRKMLIVDGRIGFTGGINISDTYSKSSPFRSKSRPRSEKDVGWRDTHVRIEGPAVQAMQWLFIQHWTGQDADDLRDADYFPTPVIAGDKLMRVLGSEPGGRYEIYKAMLLAIQEAKKSIHITCAYFVPDEQTLQALIGAAKRGVDVRIVLPSVSDSGMVFHAGRAFYDRLLEAGVQIYELKLAVLHAKTMVIDGVWSTVGSANIDRRSFQHNAEVNVIILGGAFGKEMEIAFREDVKNSNQVTLTRWRDRPLLDRMKEFASKVWDYWL